MNVVFIFATAFILNAYLCWLFICYDAKARSEKKKGEENLRFIKERKRYINNMVHGFGMKWQDAHEQYSKITEYSDLVETNIKMEELIKKHNL